MFQEECGNDNHTIFNVEIFVNFIEVENVKSSVFLLDYQIFNQSLKTITKIEFEDEVAYYDVQEGVSILARVNTFESFENSPLFLFINDSSRKGVCACGVDISGMLVDSFRNSGVKHSFILNLHLENRQRKKVGIISLELTFLHFSPDFCNIICLDKEPQKNTEKTNSTKQTNKSADAGACNPSSSSAKSKKRKIFPQVHPRMADVYKLNIEFRKKREQLICEMADLEKKVRNIEESKRRRKCRDIRAIREMEKNMSPQKTVPKKTMSSKSSKSDGRSYDKQQTEVFSESDPLNRVELIDPFKKELPPKSQTGNIKRNYGPYPDPKEVKTMNAKYLDGDLTEATWINETRTNNSGLETYDLPQGITLDVDSSTLNHTLEQTTNTETKTLDLAATNTISDSKTEALNENKTDTINVSKTMPSDSTGISGKSFKETKENGNDGKIVSESSPDPHKMDVNISGSQISDSKLAKIMSTTDTKNSILDSDQVSNNSNKSGGSKKSGNSNKNDSVLSDKSKQKSVNGSVSSTKSILTSNLRSARNKSSVGFDLDDSFDRALAGYNKPTDNSSTKSTATDLEKSLAASKTLTDATKPGELESTFKDEGKNLSDTSALPSFMRTSSTRPSNVNESSNMDDIFKSKDELLSRTDEEKRSATMSRSSAKKDNSVTGSSILSDFN